MDWLGELQRIFLGEGDTAQAAFFLEILFRTSVMYVYTIVFTRLVGQGSVGQIGPFEFVLVVAVGSAVGDPMFYPDVGLLQGMAAITVVILLHRATGYVLQRNRRLERLIEGEPLLVVEDGRICHDALGSGTLTERELYALLRTSGVRNTGEVEVAFFEPNGRLSVFRKETVDRRGQDTVEPALRFNREEIA